MVRMNNLQADGWDFSDIKYVPLGLAASRRYRLKRGDVLFNRTNSKELVGKCEVFREPGVWVFASYLIRVRFNEAVGLMIKTDEVSEQGCGVAVMSHLTPSKTFLTAVRFLNNSHFRVPRTLLAVA